VVLVVVEPDLMAHRLVEHQELTQLVVAAAVGQVMAVLLRVVPAS
jgi:hypothetical protein